MEEEPRLCIMGMFVEMLYVIHVEGTGSANQAMDLVSLTQQQFCQVTAILTGYTCYESFLSHLRLS